MQNLCTEPHSKRIKVRLRVQNEVLHGAVLEQSYIVEYVQLDHRCESCQRVQANPDKWIAAVRLRQHVAHRRSFFYLEQLILKHDAAAQAIKIKQMDQGIDFFFSNRSHGVTFVEFIGEVVPVRSRHDKQLVSHDPQSNNYNYKYTFSVEISPICREDLICLPREVSKSLSNIGPLVICSKVTNNITFLDPFTLTHCYLDADQYWGTAFKSLLTSRQLIEYFVLDMEIRSPEVNIGGLRYCLAEAQVARVSDWGKNDTTFFIKTHLGHLLNPGDYALGYDLALRYDLYGSNNNDIELDELPEAILVKKSYETKRQRNRGRPRAWKLKSLNMDADDTRSRVSEENDAEYEQFLRDLEENPDLRSNISLYKNNKYEPSQMALMTDDGEDVPSVPLEELLDWSD